MGPHQSHHGAVREIGILERHPGADHVGGIGALPVSVVLMPSDIAGEPRFAGSRTWFLDDLIVPKARCRTTHQRRRYFSDEAAHRRQSHLIVDPPAVYDFPNSRRGEICLDGLAFVIKTFAIYLA